MEDENQRIHQEVERLKKKAESLSLPGKVWELYMTISWYPTWKKNCPEWVCSVIEEISEKENGGVAFTYEGAKYEFIKNEKSGSYEDCHWNYILLTLKVTDREVFEIRMSDQNIDNRNSDYYSPEWKLSEIVVYLDGAWVNPILKLSKITSDYAAERQKIRKEKEESEKTERLKQRFGSI